MINVLDEQCPVLYKIGFQRSSHSNKTEEYCHVSNVSKLFQSKNRLLLTGPKGCGKSTCLLTTLAVLLSKNADVVYVTRDVLRFLHRPLVRRYIKALIERRRVKLSPKLNDADVDEIVATITASYDNYVDFLCEHLGNSKQPYY